MTDPTHDPRGLIAEAFEMPEITSQDCRTIFLDWAISLPSENMVASAAALAARFETAHPDHPMIAVLKEAQIPMHGTRKRRRK